jgi:hypothetical protein
MYRFDGAYYIMAGVCINQRAETKREPEVWHWEADVRTWWHERASGFSLA